MIVLHLEVDRKNAAVFLLDMVIHCLVGCHSGVHKSLIIYCESLSVCACRGVHSRKTIKVCWGSEAKCGDAEGLLKSSTSLLSTSLCQNPYSRALLDTQKADWYFFEVFKKIYINVYLYIFQKDYSLFTDMFFLMALHTNGYCWYNATLS